ncbi:LysR family transcriptional regulator [Enterovirga rhinocerotis]|uniref:DNA-binding transcriptional LysR family regulator n=1 Tax=Enterovirga rhinocerotis TaxID=1339210 RepID=A0A4R7C0T7_9HYPH|nr:LysR family transcriptional regulator [Enterovirga rhinocerotis]TDR90107.1 DNA-binding transcriptional LysR family regulator [Enterovirga rhinocerotis]
MRNLDTALLRAFVAAAETGGMTSAGNVLNLTQAAVSQQIKRLEDTLGQDLFVRSRGGLTLTDAGERLIGRAKSFLALNDAIWTEMTRSPFTGEVRLGVPYDLVATYLPAVLRRFRQAHPQVEVTLICRTSPGLSLAAAAGEVDLAVVEAAHLAPGAELLMTDRLVWAGARGGDAHRRRPLPVATSETCAFRPVIFEALRGADIPFRVVTDATHLDAASATIQTDLAIAASLSSIVPEEISVLGPESGLPELPPFTIGLHVPGSGLRAPAAELAQGLREAFTARLRVAA